MNSSPLRNASAHVAAAQKRQTCNAADRSVSPDADSSANHNRREKQLDQERRVAAELDVKADDAAQHRHLIILDQCADQPDDNSQRDTCQPQTQGQPRRFFKQRQVLNNAGTNGTAALTDSETQTLFDGDGGDQLNIHINVIAGHAHLGALGQGDDAGNVGGTEVELRTIVVEERGMTAALFLRQDVNLAVELGVGMNGAGLGTEPGHARSGLSNTTQQSADVIASLSEVQELAEHLDAGERWSASLPSDRRSPPRRRP